MLWPFTQTLLQVPIIIILSSVFCIINVCTFNVLLIVLSIASFITSIIYLKGVSNKRNSLFSIISILLILSVFIIPITIESFYPFCFFSSQAIIQNLLKYPFIIIAYYLISSLFTIIFCISPDVKSYYGNANKKNKPIITFNVFVIITVLLLTSSQWIDSCSTY